MFRVRIQYFEIHWLRQSIVKTEDSDLWIYCYTDQVGLNIQVSPWLMFHYHVNYYFVLNFVYVKSCHVAILCILSRRKSSIIIDSWIRIYSALRASYIGIYKFIGFRSFSLTHRVVCGPLTLVLPGLYIITLVLIGPYIMYMQLLCC